MDLGCNVKVHPLRGGRIFSSCSVKDLGRSRRLWAHVGEIADASEASQAQG